MENEKITKIVLQLRNQAHNDNELSQSLGISKVTLYTRLKKKNWKKTEIALIKQLEKTLL